MPHNWLAQQTAHRQEERKIWEATSGAGAVDTDSSAIDHAHATQKETSRMRFGRGSTLIATNYIKVLHTMREAARSALQMD